MRNLSRALVLILMALALSACPDNSDDAPGYTPNGEQGSGPAAPEPESNQSDTDAEQGPGDGR